MRVHFVTHHSKQAADWPFYRHFANQHKTLEVKTFADSVSLNYAFRIQLLLFGWPRLLWSATKLVAKSFRDESCPDVLVAHEHIQLLPAIILKWFSRSYRPQLVFLGFIYTPRESGFLCRIRKLYFHWILKHLDLVTVNSRIECAHLSSSFRSRVPNWWLFTMELVSMPQWQSMRKHWLKNGASQLDSSCPCLQRGEILARLSVSCESD